MAAGGGSRTAGGVAGSCAAGAVVVVWGRAATVGWVGAGVAPGWDASPCGGTQSPRPSATSPAGVTLCAPSMFRQRSIAAGAGGDVGGALARPSASPDDRQAPMRIMVAAIRNTDEGRMDTSRRDAVSRPRGQRRWCASPSLRSQVAPMPARRQGSTLAGDPGPAALVKPMHVRPGHPEVLPTGDFRAGAIDVWWRRRNAEVRVGRMAVASRGRRLGCWCCRLGRGGRSHWLRCWWSQDHRRCRWEGRCHRGRRQGLDCRRRGGRGGHSRAGRGHGRSSLHGWGCRCRLPVPRRSRTRQRPSPLDPEHPDLAPGASGSLLFLSCGRQRSPVRHDAYRLSTWRSTHREPLSARVGHIERRRRL